MKKFIICLGLGKNQLNLLKEINNSFSVIGIDIKCSSEAKKKIDVFYKGSLYNLEKIKKISKNIKKKKYNIKFILYRSSGPTILAAHYMEKYFNIERINRSLSRTIYSKSYFYRYLASIKKPGLKSISSKKMLSFKNTVLKPDAPIYGKKNIFLIKERKNSLFIKCRNESHNGKVNMSNLYYGHDISSFYFSERRSSKVCLISHLEEFNYFANNRLNSHGICSPPLNVSTKKLKKKEILDKSIINSFKNFYGIISISSKISEKKEIYPYEINIGLSGDKFADLIFPFNFNNRSLFKIELDICLNNKKIKLINNKKFIGLLNKKKITSKKVFKKKLQSIYK